MVVVYNWGYCRYLLDAGFARVYYLRDHGEYSALVGALPRCEFLDCGNGAFRMASVEKNKDEPQELFQG